ncbi:5-dehydro-4-deoxyglucarate dehydratase [Bacillus sp. ISL-47]|uniref:5-dehydro-4-deoxyglucarate dehydratase n=1 Tax=Bacillus sp. ISL-47 TaxID=2819130 RepID=UPI001BECD752|nr:5-dehydro-4-deoxyglucarate dehydratase [Bacillus sp. ISL-47]MBT2686713.1 5-dehydro-4-deoxyglucarate dehydratase [Bacillus sp. ISL-47]MBT2706939.1 5-dehydro-4-deoxyglucarate dehydratase [Pseudomonas sp. ISL-84]
MSIVRKAPTGILGFPTAPYKEDGSLDVPALTANIQFLVKEGLSSIFIACGSGEFHAISKGEYQVMIETALKAADGKVPVYSGVGGNISSALELVQLSEDLGVEGYLILPPYLITGEQEGLYHYYKTILEHSELNAILYQRDNAILNLPTLQRLVDEFPQIVGIKDGHGDMELNLEITQTLGDRLEYLNGMPFAEITMPAYLNIGFRSYSSAMSNYIPHISRLYFDALQKGNQELVRDIYVNVLLPLNKIRKSKKGYAVSLIKAGMEIMGLGVANTVRPPIVPLSEDDYRDLESVIKATLERYPIESKESIRS